MTSRSSDGKEATKFGEVIVQYTPARWWTPGDDRCVRCQLCPRHCRIAPGKRGWCGVRENREGTLFSLVYGYPAAVHNDPIEKKPLRRFLPGSRAFSVGTLGCNLGCVFCQNDSLSAYAPADTAAMRYVPPEELVALAVEQKCRSIAYTYNEPTIFAEYAVDTARLARRAGLKNVFVTNGFISLEAAAEIYPLIDAANVDMKGFSEDFYAAMCRGTLQPVLDSVKYFHSLPEKHLELTNLVIPGRNDAPELIDAWLDWVGENLGFEVPLHFSAYHPAYRFRSAPPTPPETLRNIERHVRERGFRYVYLGNI